MGNRFSNITSGKKIGNNNNNNNNNNDEALRGLRYPDPAFPASQTYAKIQETMLKIQQHPDKEVVYEFRQEFNKRFDEWKESHGEAKNFAKGVAEPFVLSVAEMLGLNN